MATQNSVNLIAGTNITLTPSGSGLTIAASGGGSSVAFGAYLENTAAGVTGNGLQYTFTGLSDTAAVVGVTNTGQFNPTTGVFTADANGLYYFHCYAEVGGLATATNMNIWINSAVASTYNGSKTFVVDAATNGYTTGSTSCIYNLTVGQTVTFIVQVNGEAADTANVNGRTSALTGIGSYIYGYKIG